MTETDLELTLKFRGMAEDLVRDGKALTIDHAYAQLAETMDTMNELLIGGRLEMDEHRNVRLIK